MTLFRRALRAAAFVALLQPLGASALRARPRHAAPIARPALWKLHRGDSTIYLFGTIHALPPHFSWETPALRTVIAHSDRLVLEAVIDDPARSTQALFDIGTAPKGTPPLADRVSPKYRRKLAAMEARSALPAKTFDGLKTWAAAMALFGVTIGDLGVSSAAGAEETLKSQFRAAGKPVEGLETLDQQLGFFDALTEKEQRAFLESVIDQKPGDNTDFSRMLAAWSHGDERAIERSFDKDMETAPALRAVLLARRNARWADLLVKRLTTPGTAFVAVGAGHLVGADSVRAKLAALGYRTTRVE